MVAWAENEPYFDEVVEAHGILGCVAWVIFFPLGAILLRVVPGSKSWIVHAAVMLFALAMFTANVGLGIWQAYELDYYHQIIGLVVFALAWVQPISGLAHHYLFQKLDRRTAISFMHMSTGRALITLGMINGGLGIWLAGDATRAERIAYGTVAGIVWVAYLTVAWVSADRAEAAATQRKTGDEVVTIGQVYIPKEGK